jgi:hypothetical protein
MSKTAWHLTMAGTLGVALLFASAVAMSLVLIDEVRWFQVARGLDYLFAILVAAVVSVHCFAFPLLIQSLSPRPWAIACLAAIAAVAIPIATWHVVHYLSMLTFDTERAAWLSVWGLALDKQAGTVTAIATVEQILAFALIFLHRRSKKRMGATRSAL